MASGAHRGAARAAFITAVGGISIASMVVLNVAADRLPWQGLKTLRDYTIRRNG